MFKNWTDVAGGKMTLKEVYQEIFFYMYHKSPKRLIIDIKLREDVKNKGYYVKLWMSCKDFNKPWQPPLPKNSKDWR